MRVAVPTQDDADALPAIAHKSQIPVIADIHFQPKYVFAAIDAGCAAVRVNPGNIRKFDDRSRRSPARRPTPARRSGSASTPARWTRACSPSTARPPGGARRVGRLEASQFEEHGFRDFKISVKHNDPSSWSGPTSCSPSAATGPCTSASRGRPGVPGHHQVRDRVRRAAEQGHRRHHPRVLSAPPVEEVKVGIQILQSLNLRPRKLEIVSCPSCGRAQVDV